MLLKRCHVQGFGKLQEFTYEFSEGLNVICTENGWGKSTFAAFLRAMFYGLPQASARTKLEDAERRKYRPWSGGVMGGSLVFEVNGKEYKAERTFGKKEAEDTFRLIDLSTNLDSADYTAELGKELFGLDKEAYSRSTYLPQAKISDGGMNDSIGKKLGKMAEGDEESGNFDKAYEMLDELRKKYIPDRQKDEKGYVAEVTRKLSDARTKYEACRRKEESAKPWREKEQNAAAERKEAQERLVLCREKLEAAAGYEALAAKKRHYTELCGQEESLRVKKDSMQGLFRAGVPELSELRSRRQEAEEAAVLTGELRSCRLDAAELAELDELQRKFVVSVPEREEVQECIRIEAESKEALSQAELSCRQAEDTAKQAKKMRKLYSALMLGCFLAAILCGAFAIFGKGKADPKQTEPVAMQEESREVAEEEKQTAVNPLLLVTGGAFALAGVVLFAMWGKQKKEENSADARYWEYTAEAENIRNRGIRGRKLLAEYGVPDAADVTGSLYRLAEEAQRYELLWEKKQRQDACIMRRERLLAGCTELLSRYEMESEDIAGSLHILENRTRDFARISEEHAEAVKKREQFERETPPETFYGVTAPETGFRELQAEEQNLLVKIARAEEEEKDCRGRAEEFEEEAEAGAETEELCTELTERLEAKKREHFFITETMKCLKTAKEQFSARYLRGLTEGFEKYVGLLGKEDFAKSLDGHYDGVRTDIDLNVRVTAYGEEKELGYFSTGTKDLIGLCMRFALVDALFAEEEPFLVLDDPFVNLDREKTERAVNFLKEAAKHYQIVYLVCHESRA